MTGGDLTINGGVGVNDNGVPTSFTVTGSLTNFDAATKTLTGGSIGVRDDIIAGTNVIFRFNGADIVNNASSIGSQRCHHQDRRSGTVSMPFAISPITSAAGSVSFTDHDFTSAGAFTNDGSPTVNGQSLPTSFSPSTAR